MKAQKRKEDQKERAKGAHWDVKQGNGLRGSQTGPEAQWLQLPISILPQEPRAKLVCRGREERATKKEIL